MTDLVIHAIGLGGGSLAISQMPGLTGGYKDDVDFIRLEAVVGDHDNDAW